MLELNILSTLIVTSSIKEGAMSAIASKTVKHNPRLQQSNITPINGEDKLARFPFYSQFNFVDRTGGAEVDIFSKGEPVEVHEFCKLNIRIEVEDNKKVKLVVGDYEVELHSHNGVYQVDGITPFHSTLGLAHFELMIDDEVYRSRAINVFGSKLTYKKASDFLKFISDESGEISQLCFATTKLGSESKNSSVDIITRKLNAGINALTFLIDNAPRFKTDPAFVFVPEVIVRPHQKHTPIDSASISYLAANPDQLMKGDMYNSDVYLNGKHFTINNIARNHAAKKYDIFENQVILAFAQHFYRFLKVAADQLKNNKPKSHESITNNNEQFYSFDRLLKETGLVLSMHEQKIKKGLTVCAQAINMVNQILPSKLVSNVNYKPIPTAKVLTKGHYRELFNLLKIYHQAEKPTWQGSMDFFGLRSLSKVYEIVCLFQIFKAIVSFGGSLEDVRYVEVGADACVNDCPQPVNEPFNYYKFAVGEESVKLYYEPLIPAFLSTGKSREFGLVDVKHNYINTPVKVYTWRPDFLLVVSNGVLVEHYHILDAKYSDNKNVNTNDRRTKREGSLSSCVHKYVDGIRVMGANDKIRRTTVNSMTILYSDDRVEKYKSYYANTLSLFNKECEVNADAVMPWLGSLPLQSFKSAQFDALIGQLLSKERGKFTI